MMNGSVQSPLSPRALGAVAIMIMSIFSQRADAMSPGNPGAAPAKAMGNGLTIEVRGMHGGSGGGRGAGGWSGGRSFGRGSVSSSFVRGGAVGVGAATVVAPAAVAGVPRYAGHGFARRHHHFGSVFVGGVYYDDYPYDDSTYYDDPVYPAYPVVYPAPAFVAGGGCYRVSTVHGPRVVCHHRVKRHYHRAHRRLHHRRLHHA